MARIFWQCPITHENLQADAAPGEEFRLSLSAAAKEALEKLYGEGAEDRFWEARTKAAFGDADAIHQEQLWAQQARKLLAGV